MTRTGAFRIGFRGGWGDWQKDLAGMARWAAEVGFELIDLGQVSASEVKAVKAAGVDVVSVDVLDWRGLLSADSGRRRDVIAANIARFREMAALKVSVFFSVVMPEVPESPGNEVFRVAVESYSELAAAAESVGGTIVLEGWPGGQPHYPNLCCNPETCRAMLKEVPSRGLSLNFDPSHLVRMGIDHTRFIEEFAPRVGHVHGKDCEILTDVQYEVGLYQASIFKQPILCGEYVWRYSIPGHGLTRWAFVFQALAKAGYRGAVSIELEDGDFNGTEAGEKAGLLAALNYLRSV